MRKSKVEEKLKKSMENITPDVLENILAKCEEKGGFENMETMKIENKKKMNFMPKLVGAMVVLMVGIFSFVGYNQYDKNYKIDSVIEFDVNPSIELQVNKKERIIDVIPLNQDGELVIKNMDLKGTDLNVGVNALIGSMLKNGYISDLANSILVSVKNEDIAKSEKLQAEITQEIDKILKVSSIDGAILAQTYQDDNEIKKLATENKLSEGKANLVNKILAAGIQDTEGKAYTFATLSQLSINELKLLLESKKTQLEQVQTTGTASEKSYIGREKAKELAYTNAGIAATDVKNVEIELDYDDGRMVYEIEFYVGNDKYEYEIDALTGNVISKEIDKNEIFDDIDDVYDDLDDRYDDLDDKYDDLGDKYDDLDDKYDDVYDDLDDRYDDLDDRYDDLDDRYDDDDDDDDDRYDD